ATWYKKKIKDSILSQVYADKNKVAGVGYSTSVVPERFSREPRGLASPGSPTKTFGDDKRDDTEVIYQRYLQAFKKGVYNYIKEEPDTITQQSVPRKYFSGGMLITPQIDYAQASSVSGRLDNAQIVTVDCTRAKTGGSAHLADTDQAMIAKKLEELPRMFLNTIAQLLPATTPPLMNGKKVLPRAMWSEVLKHLKAKTDLKQEVWVLDRFQLEEHLDELKQLSDLPFEVGLDYVDGKSWVLYSGILEKVYVDQVNRLVAEGRILLDIHTHPAGVVLPSLGDLEFYYHHGNVSAIISSKGFTWLDSYASVRPLQGYEEDFLSSLDRGPQRLMMTEEHWEKVYPEYLSQIGVQWRVLAWTNANLKKEIMALIKDLKDPLIQKRYSLTPKEQRFLLNRYEGILGIGFITQESFAEFGPRKAKQIYKILENNNNALKPSGEVWWFKMGNGKIYFDPALERSLKDMRFSEGDIEKVRNILQRTKTKVLSLERFEGRMKYLYQYLKRKSLQRRLDLDQYAYLMGYSPSVTKQLVDLYNLTRPYQEQILMADVDTDNAMINQMGGQVKEELSQVIMAIKEGNSNANELMDSFNRQSYEIRSTKSGKFTVTPETNNMIFIDDFSVDSKYIVSIESRDDLGVILYFKNFKDGETGIAINVEDIQSGSKKHYIPYSMAKAGNREEIRRLLREEATKEELVKVMILSRDKEGRRDEMLLRFNQRANRLTVSTSGNMTLSPWKNNTVCIMNLIANEKYQVSLEEDAQLGLIIYLKDRNNHETGVIVNLKEIREVKSGKNLLHYISASAANRAEIKKELSFKRQERIQEGQDHAMRSFVSAAVLIALFGGLYQYMDSENEIDKRNKIVRLENSLIKEVQIFNKKAQAAAEELMDAKEEDCLNLKKDIENDQKEYDKIFDIITSYKKEFKNTGQEDLPIRINELRIKMKNMVMPMANKIDLYQRKLKNNEIILEGASSRLRIANKGWESVLDEYAGIKNKMNNRNIVEPLRNPNKILRDVKKDAEKLKEFNREEFLRKYGEHSVAVTSASNRGGIDLTSDKALQVQMSGEGIQFHLDKAQLAQFQNAPGFVPVIVDIQPLTNLKGFLGIPIETP
ncbi:MAG: hypothetical protein HQL15_08395, partial [Candidatus Omnitrophica bacterium]|nr:hypothetical protein [Candidatus Omnitrophota bacterium]